MLEKLGNASSVKVFSSSIMGLVRFSSFNRILFALFLLPLFLPRNPRNVNGSGLMMLANGDESAEKKLLAIFISDIKKLLTHNQDFYNTYGHKDTKVDLAFDEAKLAAEIISLHPELFRSRIQRINEAIREASEIKTEDEDVTADGV
ncbi:unnamed protein product [Orchesella dallaii]|uniref:Uncharacterized protein n=1 Tax=Orchesella dallaii TaxID=48710 RepID=A0ABP1RWA7_9HEXA